LNGAAGSERAFNEKLSADNAPALALSVDMRAQFALADELQKGLVKFEAKSNAGIVLNLKTGEIIAMASLPNFDPNEPGATLPETRFNHASMSTYDLGSVFKPLKSWRKARTAARRCWLSKSEQRRKSAI